MQLGFVGFANSLSTDVLDSVAVSDSELEWHRSQAGRFATALAF